MSVEFVGVNRLSQNDLGPLSYYIAEFMGKFASSNDPESPTIKYKFASDLFDHLNNPEHPIHKEISDLERKLAVEQLYSLAKIIIEEEIKEEQSNDSEIS